MQNLMMSSGPTQVKVADDQSTLLPRAIKQAIIDPISAGTGVSVAEQTSAPHTPATESLRPMVATSSVSLFAPIWAFSFSPKVAKSVTMIGAGATTADEHLHELFVSVRWLVQTMALAVARM